MSEYADIKYSKELADLFPDADYFISEGYPAITIQMALDVLPTNLKPGSNYYLTIRKLGCINLYYSVSYMLDECYLEYISDESLPNALCKMIIHLRVRGLLNICGDHVDES